MRAGRGPVFPLSVLSIAMLSLVLCFGCSGNDGGSGPGDGGASDTDTNVDAGADTDTDSDSDGDSDADGDSDSVADAGDCTPTQSPVETTCDMLDNDCNGIIDDIDADGDGFCDCLNIGILGSSGYAPSSNFEAWLVAQGTTVTRTSLDGTTDGVVTLSGLTKNAAEKSLITKLVTDINGVTSVNNNMTIAVPVAAN